MSFHEIHLKEIDFEDDTFRISEHLESAPMLDSIREVGLVNPVVLLGGRAPRKKIVCGFRRLRALRHLDRSRALCRVVEEDHDPVWVFGVALWDNLSHRLLDPLEKARVLFKLKNSFGVRTVTLLQTYLPALGLAAHSNVLNTYLSLNEVHPELRHAFAEGRLTLSSIECLAGMAFDAQERIALVMGRIHLSASLQKEVLGLIWDLAGMTSTPPGEVLNRPEILATLSDPELSSFQKGQEVRRILSRWRNPRLAEAVKSFQARKKLLGLPGSIRISPDPFFEKPGLRVEFDASDAERFRKMAAALQKASNAPALEELFQVE